MQQADADAAIIADVNAKIDALKAADYSQATASCDFVMKGGVTSGVVYPTTICRLAQTTVFKNIGGTSAGALAAALAAAAEYERVRWSERQKPAPDGTKPEGFRRLADVPKYLGTDDNLLTLFQPSQRTKPLFDVFLALIDPGLSTWQKIARPFGVYRLRTLLAAVIAVLLFVANIGVFGAWWSQISGVGGWLLAIVALIFTFVVLAVVFVGWALGRVLLFRLVHTGYGLCTGLERPRGCTKTPLTKWLGDRIDYVAGRTDSVETAEDAALVPLTFGDLYSAGSAPADADYPYPSDPESPILVEMRDRYARSVNLEMVATDVTAGRPYRLPFSPDESTMFFYDEDELAHFFPKRVLDAMTSNVQQDETLKPTRTIPGLRAPAERDRLPSSISVRVARRHAAKNKQNAERAAGAAPAPDVDLGDLQTLKPFPSKGLPLIVAARMSMSFPVLFCAVPLYAVDRQALEDVAASPSPDYTQLEVRKTWFSDGGLSSNIPIHFFDGPIPRWPTLALNLRGYPRTKHGKLLQPPFSPRDDNDKVFLATDYDPDVEVFSPSGPGRLFQFFNSLIDAMRNWNDNTLMALPGYRERTVEIAMSDDEGGLNLKMKPATIASIMLRGYYAAERFEQTYFDPAQPNWTMHRYIRLRTALLMQSEWTRRFAYAWGPGGAQLRPAYPALVDAANAQYTHPYNPQEIAAADALAAHLAAAPQTLPAGVTLTKYPRPAPELRARPRV